MSPRPGTKSRAIARSLQQFGRSDLLPAIVAIGVAVAIWGVITIFVVPTWLPRPFTVASKAGALLGDSAFISALLSSLGLTVLGFAIAVCVGSVAGIAVALNATANMALGPYIYVILVMPSVVLAPVLLVVFGISSVNILVIVIVFAVGLIAVNTAGAVRSVDQSLLEVGRVYGATGLTLVRKIIAPSILPTFFTGLHLGITRAFKGMVVGQEFVGVIGIGIYQERFQNSFDAAGIWSLALILIGVALIFTWVVRAADHVLNYWAYQD